MGRAFPGTEVRKSYATSVLVDHWVIWYAAQTPLLTENGPQFVSKLFAAACQYLWIQHLATTAHHPQTNLQVERSNKTIVGRL